MFPASLNLHDCMHVVSVDYDIIAAIVVDIGADAPNLFRAKCDADYFNIIVAVRPQCRCTLKATCRQALIS